MLALSNPSVPTIFAAGLSVAMAAVAFLTWFYHDSKHRDLDSWIQYGFSGDTLRHVLLYYRSMFVSMLVFYVLFVLTCILLQGETQELFTEDGRVVAAGPFGIAVFSLDLVLRGGLFDIMEHFDLHVTALQMNRAAPWFVIYCFVFRMYYSLTLIRLALSFAWIWARIYSARKKQPETAIN